MKHFRVNPSGASRERRLLSYMVSASIVWCASAICVDGQTFPSAPDESWTTSSENLTVHSNPYRTTESHVKSGNRTVDQTVMEIRGTDGRYEPYVRIETETIEIEPHFTKSTTRTYNPGQDQNEHMTQITEVETRDTGTTTHIEKTISNVGYDGKLQLKEREASLVSKIGNSQNTQTTVYLLSVSGQFAPSIQINKHEETMPDGAVQIKEETLFQDLSGRWQTYEVRERTTKGDDQDRTTEERLARRDYDGKVSPVSQVITTEHSADGQLTSASQTYSIDSPGSTRDGNLHLSQSSTTVRRAEGRRIVTEQQTVLPDVGEKGLSTIFKTNEITVRSNSGNVDTITVTARYPDGSPSVVSLETRKSDTRQ